MIFPKVVGFDVETRGDLQEYALQPYRLTTGQAQISAASVAVDGNLAGTMRPTSEHLDRMLSLAISEERYIIGWNVSFDAAWVIAAGHEEKVFKARWLDAMLLWRHAAVEPEGEDVPRARRKSYSLESAMKEFYPYHSGFKEFKDFQSMEEEDESLLLHRNKMDAYWPVLLGELFWNMLTDRQQVAALIEAVCIPLIAKSKVDGIVAGKDEALKLEKALAEEAKAIESAMLASSPEIEGVNLGSSQQLQKLIYETWGLSATRFSKKTGAPSTDKYALFDLAALDPRAKQIKKLREAKNNRKKYAIGTLNSLDYNGDGCVRPQAKIFSTYTSRITYASSDSSVREVEKETKAKGIHTITKKETIPIGIALHQWKRGKDYRNIIKVPEGYTLGELDAAGQEFRWMAVASGDETMLSLCAPGEDAHGFMGSQVVECDYRELVAAVKAGDETAIFHRKAGKFCNLSYQYRTSAKTATTKARVEYDLDVDIAYIQRTQDVYKDSYPGVGGYAYQKTGGYWLSQILKCRELGYAETFAGRRVQLRGNWFGKDAWPLESTAINYPIQGTGGDQKYLALAIARNELPKFCGKFYFELHDGLFFIFPDDKVVQAMIHMRKMLSNLPYKSAWGIDLPIQFPFDAKIGKSWGALEDLDKFM